jgi:hypothetical protein
METASDTYEDFRANYEYSSGEKELRPWPQLSKQEQDQWEEQWRRYTGELDTTGGVKHGDPAVTDLHKPRA